MIVLPWEPLFGLKPFYFLFIETIILELWLIRCYGNESVFVTIKAAIVLYLTFICIFTGFVWVFSGTLLDPIITVINAGNYQNSVFPPVFEVVKKYRPFDNQVIWQFIEVYSSSCSEPSFVPVSHFAGFFAILDKIMSPSLYNIQAMHFYTPAPLLPNSYLVSEMMNAYILAQTAPPLLMPADIAKYSFRWHMYPQYNALYVYSGDFLKFFLSNRINTDLLFLSFPMTRVTTSPLIFATSMAHATVFNGFVTFTPEIAALLNAASTYSLTHQLSLSDYLGLLKLLAPSMKSYSFNYVSAFSQFFTARYFKLILFKSIFLIILILNYRRIFNLLFKALLRFATFGITRLSSHPV